MNVYISLVQAHPILTAMAQFALLGTMGELVSKWLVSRRFFLPFTPGVSLLKALGWAALAVCIKYAFVGFVAFTDGLVVHGFLPEPGVVGRAFLISAFMNLQFGPFLVICHRLIDNAIEGRTNWGGLDKAFLSLLWFWIPAHTVTFLLPPDFRIGLAAVWSLALGLILGFYSAKKPA